MTIYKWLNKEKSRFYNIAVHHENTSEIILSHVWGGCNSNRGGKKNISVQSEEEAQKYIEKMKKRRKSSGYFLITP